MTLDLGGICWDWSSVCYTSKLTDEPQTKLVIIVLAGAADCLRMLSAILLEENVTTDLHEIKEYHLPGFP